MRSFLIDFIITLSWKLSNLVLLCFCCLDFFDFTSYNVIAVSAKPSDFLHCYIGFLLCEKEKSTYNVSCRNTFCSLECQESIDISERLIRVSSIRKHNEIIAMSNMTAVQFIKQLNRRIIRCIIIDFIHPFACSSDACSFLVGQHWRSFSLDYFFSGDDT